MIEQDIVYTEDQEKALESIEEWLSAGEWLSGIKPYKTLSGYAGTGKTTLLDKIVQSIKDRGKSYLVTATTNKAVKVLTDRVDADYFSTIHSALNIRPQRRGTKEIFKPVYGRNGMPISRSDIVIVDECSMISSKLLDLIEEHREDARVLFCGDPAQLQPINETISKCFEFDPVILTKVVRHGDTISNKAKLLRESSDIVEQESLLEPPIIRKIEERDLEHVFNGFRDNPDKARVLCWRNKQVDRWNEYLRALDWGEEDLPPFIKGDIVIANEPCQFQRDGEKYIVMMNSEEGEVIKVRETGTSHLLKVRKMDGEEVTVNKVKEQYKKKLEEILKNHADNKRWSSFWELKESYHDIKHCYAMTTHKSQGSTFDRVVLDWQDVSLNKDILNRNQLFYVGLTRAAEQVLVI